MTTLTTRSLREIDTPALAAPAPAGFITRAARRAAVGRLDRLQQDWIVIREDGGDTWAFGDPFDPSGLKAGVRVHDPVFFRRLIAGGSLGAAESFLDGQWSSDDLTSLLRIAIRNRDVIGALENGGSRLLELLRRLAHRARRNSVAGSRRNIHEHYDLGNDLFALFLDETMTYSAGIFEAPGASLRDAQTAKLDRIARKLRLGPDDHVLEIGTGWGSFAIHAAREYGARVTTTTISREQRDLAVRRIREAGVENRVTVLLEDYRKLTGTYDKLVSIEMIEAVGHDFQDEYFGKCASLLRPEGEMLLQAITMPDQGYDRYLRSVDFIQKHVFPGSCLPSLGSIADSTAKATDFRTTHIEDLTPHYAATLRVWRERFFAKLHEVRALGYPERFVRLWDYYLSYCEAGFTERVIGDYQILFARPGCRSDPILAELA